MTAPIADKAELLRRFNTNRLAAAQSLFPHRHQNKTAPFHVDIFDMWRSKDQYVQINAFRKSAKTTLGEEFLILEALFGNFPFALVVSNSHGAACRIINTIKYEIENNERIHMLFGQQRLGEEFKRNQKWREDEIELLNGVKIQGFGRGQSLRGVKHLNHLPRRVLVDDLEDDISVSTTDQVNDTMAWLYAELMPAAPEAKFIINGTPLATDCMVTRLKDNPDWKTREFPIVRGDLDSDECEALWPDRFSVEWVRKKRDDYVRAGQANKFSQEYLLQPLAASERPFHEPDIRIVAQEPRFAPKYAIYDPARTAKKKSDRTGKIVAALGGTRITVIESAGERWKPDQIIKDIFECNDKHHPILIGVETTSLEEFIMQPLRAESLRRGVSLPIHPLRAPHVGGKPAFIRALQPFFTAHEVEFVGEQPALKSELLTYPSTNDDIVNALAYLITLRPGEPVYPDFREEHVDELPANFGNPLALAFQADGRYMTAAALQINPRSLNILHDWIIEGDSREFVKRVLDESKVLFGRISMQIFVPDETLDNWARSTLVPAIKDEKLIPHRSGSVIKSRSSLAPWFLKRNHDGPALTVNPAARITINALLGGFHYPVGSDGRLLGQPADNGYRRLMEGIECVAGFLGERPRTEAAGNWRTTASGARYKSTLPQTH